ncbi:hypothetical protein ACRBEV_29510 [Methylobacterium phyllosphaerae]
MTQQTITALFDRYDDASVAVGKLEAGGIPHGDISIVSNNENDRHTGMIARDGDHVSADTKEKAKDGTGAGATLGTVVGGAAGLLAGLGLIAIPGVGPVVAAGWLVATLTGAGVGAAAGGLAGGLTGAGVSEKDAHAYGEGVRRGGTLVTVRADESRGPMVMDILEQHGSVDLDQKAATWRQDGWTPATASDAGTSAQMGTSDVETNAGRRGCALTPAQVADFNSRRSRGGRGYSPAILSLPKVTFKAGRTNGPTPDFAKLESLVMFCWACVGSRRPNRP